MKIYLVQIKNLKLPPKQKDYFEYKTYTIPETHIKIDDLFEDIIETQNKIIDYLEYLEDRIKDLERGELYQNFLV